MNIFKQFKQKLNHLLLKKKKSKERDYTEKLLTNKTAYGVNEAYRMARTNILYSGFAQGTAIFGVSSALPNEGKSVTTANLAISFAMAEKKVLLIDADIRNPTQRRLFHKKERRGLSDYLSGISDKPVIQDTEYNNLSVLIAGKRPPNPSELLQSKHFAELLNMVNEQYDYIFIDLPPVNVVSDASVVVSHLSGYILLVDTGASTKTDIRSATESLTSIGGKIVGFIMNRVPQKGGRGYGRYGRSSRYGNYGRYGSYELSYGENNTEPKLENTKHTKNNKK